MNLDDDGFLSCTHFPLGQEKGEKMEHSIVDHEGLRFVISGAPRDDTISEYVSLWKSLGVKHVVRVCEPTYDSDRPRESGIEVHDFCNKDGDIPSQQSIDNWLALLNLVFGAPKERKSSKKQSAIAVHCIAGLGRSPVLVAVALLEYGFSDPLEVIQFVRTKRPGSLNLPQVNFLKSYKPHGKCVIS